MLAKTTLICLALGLLMPALASADIYNKRSLQGKDNKSLRQTIAAKLNAMPGSVTGRANGTFLQSKITGSFSTHAGFAGTSYSVSFQAQPRLKMKVNGKTTSVYLGGCYGACNVLRLAAGKFVAPQVQISGKLREAPAPR